VADNDVFYLMHHFICQERKTVSCLLLSEEFKGAKPGIVNNRLLQKLFCIILSNRYLLSKEKTRDFKERTIIENSGMKNRCPIQVLKEMKTDTKDLY